LQRYNPAPGDDLRKQGAAKGAALFARGEGIFWGKGELFFACTNGGAAKYGQIFRYVPSTNEGSLREAEAPGLIDLFMESTNPAFYNYGDNIVVMPTGHLLVYCFPALSSSHLPRLTISVIDDNAWTLIAHRRFNTLYISSVKLTKPRRIKTIFAVYYEEIVCAENY
jgi:hypothetical protein